MTKVALVPGSDGSPKRYTVFQDAADRSASAELAKELSGRKNISVLDQARLSSIKKMASSNMLVRKQGIYEMIEKSRAGQFKEMGVSNVAVARAHKLEHLIRTNQIGRVPRKPKYANLEDALGERSLSFDPSQPAKFTTSAQKHIKSYEKELKMRNKQLYAAIEDQLDGQYGGVDLEGYLPETGEILRRVEEGEKGR